MTYRWKSPLDWMATKLDEADDPATLRSYAKSLLGFASSDDIQDEFQGEMDADGYFEEIKA